MESCVKPFWNYRDELNVVKDVVFKNSKLVVPKGFQSEMLKRIHEDHLEVTRCKR